MNPMKETLKGLIEDALSKGDRLSINICPLPYDNTPISTEEKEELGKLYEIGLLLTKALIIAKNLKTDF